MTENYYSQTCHKGLPKMLRFSGRLREVVVYESRTRGPGVSSRNRSDKSAYSRGIYCIHFS